ncbi:hypothetical protein PHJA_002657300, partial [Phtheirospermum japonicum]
HLYNQKGPRRRIDLHDLQGLLRRFPLRRLSEILSAHGYCWWAAASTTKLGLGISAIKRGHAGESTFMPFKAFSVASLFVGVAASAAMASLHSSDLQSIRYSCCYFVFGVKNPDFTV